MNPRCARLPILHFQPDMALDFALPLWPGVPLGGLEYFYKPANYPYQEDVAGRLLQDFRNLDLDNLESMRIQLGQSPIAAQIDRYGELTALKEFSGARAEMPVYEMQRRQAQKTLIWLWAMEEKLAEIAELEAKCQVAENRLQSAFRENEIVAEKKAHASNLFEDMLPWKACLASAVYFLPADMPIFLENFVIAQIEDFINFQPAQDSFLTVDKRLVRAKSPLWRVLGHSRPATDENTCELFNIDRLWFGLSDE